MSTGGFSRWFDRKGWVGLVIGLPYVWLVALFLLPFLIVLAMSVATNTPTAPPFSFGGEHPWINLGAYERIATDGLYVRAFLTSIFNAFVSAMLCLLIGYPMALGLTRVSKSWRNILLMLVILPFWTSFLLRVYALSGFLRGEGVINNTLAVFGLGPLTMMQTDFAVYVGIVYSYLPFFILPLYTNLVKLDPSLLEASADLGARPIRTFFSVTLPLSMPGVVAGAMLVFIPAIGEFVIPSLLGGPGTQMIGRILWDEFFSKTNWPRAAALAITMLFIVVIPIMLMQRAQNAVVEGRR